jgi:ABC-type Fe3+ transport system substrate-binding protein
MPAHAALLFTDWSLSEEGQKVLAVHLGKGVAMKVGFALHSG